MLTKVKQIYMEVLKINNKKATFLKIVNKDDINDNSYKSISKINKNDILNLLEYLLENDFEYDDNSSDIGNEAEKIIYENLVKNIIGFEDNKSKIIENVNLEFSEFENRI